MCVAAGTARCSLKQLHHFKYHKRIPNREVHPDARHRIMEMCAAPQSAAVFGERYRALQRALDKSSRITASLGDGAPPVANSSAVQQPVRALCVRNGSWGRGAVATSVQASAVRGTLLTRAPKVRESSGSWGHCPRGALSKATRRGWHGQLGETAHDGC